MTAWQHPKNAVAFAAVIADLAITQHRAALVDEIKDVVEGQLRAGRSELLSDEDWMRPEEAAQFKRFRDRFRVTDPTRAVFALVDLVGKLWTRPENRLRHIYRYGQQAGIDPFEIARVELQYRLRDQDPEARLSENHRLAFEAAWLAGRQDFAVQLVRRELNHQ